MGITIDEAIQHIKNSCYIVGYPTHDRQNETRKRINASLDMAIDIMRKYQKIEQIIHDDWIKGVNSGATLNKIEEVLEDEE